MNECDPRGADLSGASICEANLIGADLRGANFEGADLREADLTSADLTGANFSHSILDDASLMGARLVGTKLCGARLKGCYVYGISVWDIDLQDAVQSELVITNLFPEDPYVANRLPTHLQLLTQQEKEHTRLTVDKLEVAAFIYLLLNNRAIRDVIDTISSKAVLILGRFTPERMLVLNSLRDGLRKRNYLPIVFDFQGPATRDTTETISTLAHLSRFVIADISDADTECRPEDVLDTAVRRVDLYRSRGNSHRPGANKALQLTAR